jgi:hypothetical protein
MHGFVSELLLDMRNHLKGANDERIALLRESLRIQKVVGVRVRHKDDVRVKVLGPGLGVWIVASQERVKEERMGPCLQLKGGVPEVGKIHNAKRLDEWIYASVQRHNAGMRFADAGPYDATIM